MQGCAPLIVAAPKFAVHVLRHTALLPAAVPACRAAAVLFLLCSSNNEQKSHVDSFRSLNACPIRINLVYRVITCACLLCIIVLYKTAPTRMPLVLPGTSQRSSCCARRQAFTKHHQHRVLWCLAFSSISACTLLHRSGAARYQSEEFLLRTEAGMSAPELVAAATLHCAQLFNKEVRLYPSVVHMHQLARVLLASHEQPELVAAAMLHCAQLFYKKLR